MSALSAGSLRCSGEELEALIAKALRESQELQRQRGPPF